MMRGISRRRARAAVADAAEGVAALDAALRQVPGSKLVQTAAWAGRTIPRRGTALGAALSGETGEHGYVARTGAVEPDVTSIAAPVHGPDGNIAAALSVLIPTYRASTRRVQSCGRAVARHAAELSGSLGAPAVPARGAAA